MPPENRLQHKRGGIGQPVEPPDLRGPGATHVDYPTVLVAHGDAEVRGGERILFERPETKVLFDVGTDFPIIAKEGVDGLRCRKPGGSVAVYETQRLRNTRWHVC